MTFEVKYRNKQGAVEYTRVDAASRSEVFTVLKDRGITSVIQVMDATGKKPRKATSSGAPLSGKIKGLMALVAVCVIGAVVFMCVSKDEPKPTVEEKKPAKETRIEVVTPEVVPRKVEPKPELVEEEKPAVVTNYNEKGVWYDDRGRPHYKPARVIVAGSNTIIGGKPWVPPRRIFNHVSEVELDRVLSAKPGERIIGETNWRLFAKDLQQAMVDPIHIEPEDSEEEVQRKQDVIAAKKELAAMIADGEDPCAVLKQAQDDMNRLADLYDGLNRTLYEARTSGELSEQEIEDYVKAANQMLESRNIFTKKFYTPQEIREKAEAAKMRKFLKQQNQ